ncbi:hypothetical protein Q8A73_020431 [Channa argus]|nr:hypothetical protein Q8A73_020431 [Channa argus]
MPENPCTLTDSSGRGLVRQRHGDVFVRVCGTVFCVIEAQQQIIVPVFGAGVHGAEEQPEKGDVPSTTLGHLSSLPPIHPLKLMG